MAIVLDGGVANTIHLLSKQGWRDIANEQFRTKSLEVSELFLASFDIGVTKTRRESDSMSV